MPLPEKPEPGVTDNDQPLLPEIEVDVPAPVDTGLLNARGHRIYRTPRPIGFGRHDKWTD